MVGSITGGVLDDRVFVTIAAGECMNRLGQVLMRRCAAESAGRKSCTTSRPGRRAPLLMPFRMTILMFGGQTQVATASLYVGGQP